MEGTKKRFHWIIFSLLIALAFLLLLVFVGWYLFPTKNLDLVLLDKTVVGSGSNSQASSLEYRKHIGLFWMLSDQKYDNPLTGTAYDYTKDYYGTFLKSDGTSEMKDLQSLDRTPDVVYLSDTYGSDAQQKTDAAGLSYSEIAAAASAHANGATLIGESDLISSTSDSVQQEIHSLFGFTHTGWVGRYVADLQDVSDIPAWAVQLQEQQYGRMWDYKGEGLLLVSSEGEIIVLQQGTDFTQDPLTVQITPAFRSKFGSLKVDYYNWFELINSNYGTDVVAQYQFNLNDTGLSKFSKVSSSTVFPAVTCLNSSRAPAYYFAGDFNDCVGWNKYTNFLFSSTFFRIFSFDRKGDITHFYWDFYRPVMSVVLKDSYENKANVVQPQANDQATVKIQDNQFQVLKGSDWQTLNVKGFNINASLPGEQAGDATRDISVYSRFLSEIAGMGGNCIRAKDLLPPEFYRALYEYNNDNPDQPVYFLQSIEPPSGVSGNDYASQDVQTLLKQNAQTVVDAVHGNASVTKQGDQNAWAYINDVSPYLLGYIVDPGLSADTVQTLNQANPGYTYSGTYVSADGSCAESVEAMLCDAVYTYQQQQYGYLTPVGALGNAALLQGLPWSPQDQSARFDAGSLKASGQTDGTFFVSYALDPSASYFLNNTASFANYADEEGAFAFGGFVHAVKAADTAYPLLIDGVGLSTNVNAFEKETAVNGLSESDQGSGLVRMLKTAQNEGTLGALISDLNDQWSVSSQQTASYTIPQKDKPLWQDALDPLQNTGVIAVEPTPPDQEALGLKDSGLMQELQLSADEKYLYATIILNREIQYDTEQLIVGLDTYQRNNGEYLYDPSYFATSLSGMEYVVKFDSKSSAGLYAVPAYDRNKGVFSSAESYSGAYDYIATLKYGSFDSSDGELYQTGSTIHLRIPWGMINVTDPSQRIVLDDNRTPEEIAADPFGFKTVATDGILVSLLVADKTTKDTVYIFPQSKQATGYKLFTWDSWKSAEYRFREKGSYGILKDYFESQG